MRNDDSVRLSGRLFHAYADRKAVREFNLKHGLFSGHDSSVGDQVIALMRVFSSMPVDQLLEVRWTFLPDLAEAKKAEEFLSVRVDKKLFGEFFGKARLVGLTMNQLSVLMIRAYLDVAKEQVK